MISPERKKTRLPFLAEDVAICLCIGLQGVPFLLTILNGLVYYSPINEVAGWMAFFSIFMAVFLLTSWQWTLGLIVFSLVAFWWNTPFR